jgi:tetratricopeptide (TPR) repeat protein
MALRIGNAAEAVADFSGAGDTGWLDWAQGLLAFQSGNYTQAAAHYGAAIDTWKALWNGPGRYFVRQMGPRPDVTTGLVDLGGAQMVAGNPQQAMKTLDEALKLDPAAARAYFLRARTREIAGHANEALADYNLAARAAFAASEDLVSGEAHLYRGILMFRRKDYARAEDEFSSALNFSIGGALRPDAEAWRQLAAVASGSCVTARQTLERSLPAVSPFFPKQEARAIAAACSASAN